MSTPLQDSRSPVSAFVLSGLMLGMFLGALDQTIVSTAIRTIADDLHGLSEQAWVTTAYLITSTITTPIYGKLGDLHGRKKLFLVAITIFVLGSVLCSFADSMYQLAACRAFQGLGAGGLFTLVLAIIGDLVGPRERARYTGYFMSVFGLTSVLGPLIGGFFADRADILGVAGWRWVFLVNVPVGILAFLVVLRALDLPVVRERGVRVDVAGAVALTIGLVPLLVVAEQGRDWGWTSARSITAYVVAALGLVAFALVERRAGDSALIPLRVFRIRAVAVTVIASVVVGAAMFGGIMLLPLYLQIVHGASPTDSGLLMLPLVAGIATGSVVSGQIIARLGHLRIFPVAGAATMTVGLFLLSWLAGPETSMVKVGVGMAVLGLGLGNCLQPFTLIVQNAVPPREIGVATSAATFFRQIGGTLGVAVFLSILFAGVGGNIGKAVEQDARTEAWQQTVSDPRVLADPVNRQLIEALKNPAARSGAVDEVQADSSVISELDPVLAHPFKVGFAESIDTVFFFAGGLGVLGFLVLLALPSVRLRDKHPGDPYAGQDAPPVADAAAAARAPTAPH
ncbi:DHA2 family efflux MFS transporter permease subunit [Nocardioides sp. zg-579]|uniref:DHA2 family efflux MFS transporter permease subunit n=1 Tax=Nocardioides marmotae TaxID=2663857 RepID=A0A6I3JFN5_9ACTN|nr:MDR family MFS transporter [Nocardioides marmotae]MCR6033448.1 DHA2 family efflux MFS transporter permease subunit [Gordonia jinghuaiqii]MTB97106.1 DHA2 family efflux MFS transporter permease subunit [Nocardioides marmotae]QKE00762.1 MFS transporter [Nocardioides marmotae]